MFFLRELEFNDLSIINEWRNNKDVIDCLGAPFRYINIGVDENWYKNYMNNRGNSVRCAILNNNKQIIGLVSLTNINHLNQSAEFHIMIGDKNSQGKGAGFFATNAMLKHAFYNLNLHRVELSALEYNIPANRLYQKVGFVKEGIKRLSNFKNGKFVSLICYGILRDEYINQFLDIV